MKYCSFFVHNISNVQLQNGYLSLFSVYSEFYQFSTRMIILKIHLNNSIDVKKYIYILKCNKK